MVGLEEWQESPTDAHFNTKKVDYGGETVIDF